MCASEKVVLLISIGLNQSAIVLYCLEVLYLYIIFQMLPKSMLPNANLTNLNCCEKFYLGRGFGVH